MVFRCRCGAMFERTVGDYYPHCDATVFRHAHEDPDRRIVVLQQQASTTAFSAWLMAWNPMENDLARARQEQAAVLYGLAREEYWLAHGDVTREPQLRYLHLR